MSDFINNERFKRINALTSQDSQKELSTPFTPPVSRKKCPKCKENMNKIKHRNSFIDKCPACSGFWLREGQLEYLCEHLTERQLNNLNAIGSTKSKKKNFNNLFIFNRPWNVQIVEVP